MPKWEDRDLPVLRAVAAAEDSGTHRVDVNELAGALQLEPIAVARSIVLLHEQGYIGGHPVTAHDEKACVLIFDPHLRERGLRATGEWPSQDDVGEDLLREFEQRIDAAPDVETKGRLRRAADALSGVSKDVLTDVMTKVIERRMGV